MTSILVRCATCTWWQVPGWEFGGGVRGKCNCPALQDCKSQNADSACVDEDPYLTLFTGPEFGCVHHTE